MRNERKKGVTFSGVMHGIMILLVIVGLPSIFMLKREPEPSAITVEILPITGVTNIKPSEKPPAPKQKQEEKKPEEKKPTPKVVTKEPTPPEPKPEPKPEEKKPEVKKPEEKKPEEKKEKEKPKEDDFMAVLKAAKDMAAKEKSDTPDKKPTEETSESKSKSDQYNPELPLSMSEKDAIRSQIARCWSVPAGAKDAHELIVVLRISVQQDGTVTDVQLGSASKSKYSRDSFFRAAADSAIRAVKMCSPLQNLPPAKYDTWKEMELTFDPKEMLF